MKPLNGDDLIYRFLQNLLETDSDVAEAVTDLVVRSTSVWFPTHVYAELPVLLPWVVRDPSCRPKMVSGVKTPDEWGAPNEQGYFRDDNSLIKGIPRSLKISGHRTHLDGGKLGNGWVACHIWRHVNHVELASRHPLLNSFVPNLVWLPRQIAKLSDREGSQVQTALKRASWGIYRHIDVRSELEDVANEAWALIPEPAGWKPVNLDELHVFECGDKFLKSRREPLIQVKTFLDALLTNSPVPKAARISGRYRSGLPKVDAKALQALHAELTKYV